MVEGAVSLGELGCAGVEGVEGADRGGWESLDYDFGWVSV